MAKSLAAAASEVVIEKPEVAGNQDVEGAARKYQYRLIHFVARGLAEPIRWMFHLSKTPFEDHCIWPGDPVPKVKSVVPLKYVPIMEEGDRGFTQSFAMGRYLAKKLGYVTNDPLLDLKGEMIVEVVKDCRLLSRTWITDKIKGTGDQDKVDKRLDEIFSTHLQLLTTLITEFPGDYVLGDKITYADFVLVNWLDIWEICLGPQLLQPFKALMDIKIKVLGLPAIRENRLARNQSMFAFDIDVLTPEEMAEVDLLEKREIEAHAAPEEGKK